MILKKNTKTLLNKSGSIQVLLASIAFSFPAYSAINIESYSGSNVQTPSGVPIFASNSRGKHLNKYTRNGSMNNYTWLDNNNRALSDNLVFTPTIQHIGKRVRLCKINGTGVECSNELRITRAPATRNNRALPLFTDNWDYENKFTDNFVFNDETELKVSTHYDYNGPANATSGPAPTLTLARITDVATGSDLVSLAPSSEAPRVIYADHPVNFTLNINYGTTALIKFCTTIFATDTFPVKYENPDKCKIRTVRDGDKEGSDTTYFYPPTPAQFSSLFPNVTFKNNESVGDSTTYTSGPRVTSGHENLLSEYCSSIGTDVDPLNENDLVSFLSSDSYDDTWPESTAYWTNVTDNTEPFASVVPLGMGIVAAVTTGNNVESSASPNAYYRGFYVCKKKS